MSQFTDLDYYDLANHLDFVTMSSYPTGHAENAPSLYMSSSVQPTFAHDVGDPYITGFGHTLMRGFKPNRPFWVMEQQCGNVNWSSYNTGVGPGATRLWTWHALASGAEAVVYFRWRAGLYAQEQMHSGLLHHDATFALGYKDLESMEAERALMNEISSTPYDAQIAFLLDYDALWAAQLQPHNRDFGLLRHLFVYYRALQRLGIPSDIISVNADFSRYKMIIMPTAFMATEQSAASLKTFAEAGGTVLLGVRSGFKTVDNQVIDQPLPGLFRELVDITVDDWYSIPPGNSFDLRSTIPNLVGSATIWAEALKLGTSVSQSTNPELQTLAHYISGPFVSYAALVEHKIGVGRALYLGWYPDDSQAEALMVYLTAQAGISSQVQLPDGMIILRRGQHFILLNFTEKTLNAKVQGRTVSVDPRDIKVIETK